MTFPIVGRLIPLIEAMVLAAQISLLSPYSAVIDTGRMLPKTVPRASVTVLTVAGEVDAGTGDQLARDLRRCAATEQPVIADLSMLNFFGVRGLHILIEFDRRFRARGLPSVVVTCPMVDLMANLTGTSDLPRRVKSLRAAGWQLRSELVGAGRRTAPLAAREALQC